MVDVKLCVEGNGGRVDKAKIISESLSEFRLPLEKPRKPASLSYTTCQYGRKERERGAFSRERHISTFQGLILTFKGGKSSVEDELQVAELPLSEGDGGESFGLPLELVMTGAIAGDEILEDAAMGWVGHCFFFFLFFFFFFFVLLGGGGGEIVWNCLGVVYKARLGLGREWMSKCFDNGD